MITGLRHEGSSIQDILKLSPTISTFGKCLGGGLPIGIIAIKKNIETKLLRKDKKLQSLYLLVAALCLFCCSCKARELERETKLHRRAFSFLEIH